ncbi:MAG: nicotinate-nucleotide adenylyltransferase [Candidatus Omnitrophica bacterium]|nr:nicotinate-nucleotide adenylyltransferase [Candidatus Omnitrophota bacterium]
MTPKTSLRIGVLGGTFDPIHEGHLALARAAVKQLKLDRLMFVPAFRHPLHNKENRTIASPEDRFEMAKLAAKEEPKFKVSDCELKRKGISYTVDTLRELRREFPMPNEIFFITGGDWGKALDQWKDIDTIFSLVHFVVAKRPGFDMKNLPQGVELLNFVPLDISSTEIRNRLRKGQASGSLVSEAVLDYIRKHRLYSR